MKQTILKSLGLVATIALISATSCQKEIIIFPTEDDTPIIQEEIRMETTEGQTVLGDTIVIPYSIENLLKAYDNLPSLTKSQIDPDAIQPTHYYIRFYPKSIAELDILRNINPYVFLSEIPLDRKIIIGGSSYHDPSIPNDLPTFQYTVIPVSRWDSLRETVPVETEILIKAFIPDYEEECDVKSPKDYGMPINAYEDLMKEAFSISGNEYDFMPETKSSSWNPSGRIRAYDDNSNTMIAVPGVRVRATHLLKVKETLTDVNGRFTLPTFSNDVTFRIIWESDDWDIRDGSIGQATFDGPTGHMQWFPEIGATHSENVRYAAIQRAAYRYFYGEVNGLYRPIISNKLKICQHDSGNIKNGYYTPSTQNINIYIKNQAGSYRLINVIYHTAAQELAHAVHHSWSGNNYDDFCNSMKESWSIFVAGLFCNLEYGFFPTNYFYWPEEDLCSSSGTFNIEYTPLFLDLYDNINQHDYYYGCPDDLVTGYTPATLNYLMLSSPDLCSLKTNAKYNKPSGVTETMIDTLFYVYENNWVETYD